MENQHSSLGPNNCRKKIFERTLVVFLLDFTSLVEEKKLKAIVGQHVTVSHITGSRSTNQKLLGTLYKVTTVANFTYIFIFTMSLILQHFCFSLRKRGRTKKNCFLYFKNKFYIFILIYVFRQLFIKNIFGF